MSELLQTVKGTKDFLPTDCSLFKHVVETAGMVSRRYGYEEVMTPIFEYTELFKRSLGDYSDIVSKEMYSFIDKGNRLLTLRPEFTASLCRALISNSLQDQLPIKFYSYGPVFRNENPQKGRYRQFHQLNCEFMGAISPLADSEIIAMAAHILNELNLLDKVQLEINSLGCKESRLSYREALVTYLSKYKDDLSEDSKVRLVNNPLRVLDSKDVNDQKLLQDAPLISDYYTTASKNYFNQVLEGLDRLGINYYVNQKLVRGLDYYCHTAFEFTTKMLGAQGTVLAGGRYDGLIASLGGKDISGIGFAGGIERLMLLLENEFVHTSTRPIYLINIGDEYQIDGFKLSQKLRNHGFSVIYEYSSAKIAKRMKSANHYNASVVLFLGEDEIKNERVKLKDLDSGEELYIANIELINRLERYKNV